MAKRKWIIYGFSWIRFVLIPVALGFLSEAISSDINRWINIAVVLFCIGLFMWMKKLRKLKYDEENLYIIRAKSEKVVHYSKIRSIKRSKAKVNGTRYWILRYEDEDNKEKKIRYFLSFFYGDFHNKVKEINPEVVIWTHPHFNH